MGDITDLILDLSQRHAWHLLIKTRPTVHDLSFSNAHNASPRNFHAAYQRIQRSSAARDTCYFAVKLIQLIVTGTSLLPSSCRLYMFIHGPQPSHAYTSQKQLMQS